MPRLTHPLVALLALCLAWCRMGAPASAQDPCPLPIDNLCTVATGSIWLGDMNNDLRVNAIDLQIWETCFRDTLVPSGGYCAAADFNYDGQIDNDDRNLLQKLVSMAASTEIGRLPKTRLSEVRTGKPFNQTDPTVPESRYVEIRTPPGAFTPTDPGLAPTVNQPNPGDPTNSTRLFGPGWFYVKVSRSTLVATGDQSVWGTLAVVVPLEGLPWVVEQNNVASVGMSLVKDGSFEVGSTIANSVPAAVRPFEFTVPGGGSLAIPFIVGDRFFAQETRTNVTHMIVYRDPRPANPRQVPAVGQRVNGAFADLETRCEIPFQVPVDGTLPPWDAIVDAVTLVRGESPTNYGCIFANTGSADIGPAGSGDSTAAIVHMYRCRNAGTLTRGAASIGPNSDTPFARNPSCATVVTGCGETDVDGNQRDCFQEQSAGGGCTDADCCNAVCEIDPTCCSQVWDQDCANQALVTCRTCGQNPASCTEPHDTPACENQECCEKVCVLDPSCCQVAWDADCVTLAVQQCLECGSPVAGPCDAPHSTPFCSDAECCQAVCEIKPECCAIAWDQACVNLADQQCSGCGAAGSGDCCVIHPTPFCENGRCCAAVCAQDPICCEISWDFACTQFALVLPACDGLGCICGELDEEGLPISCFEEHRDPGCSEAFCCQLVCQRDPYCCYVAWDAPCVEGAVDLCSNNPGCLTEIGLPVNGSCFVPRLTPGCDRPGCCTAVCTDPEFADCCTIAWDADCVLRAAEICEGCGDPYSGSCYVAKGAPNCSDAECCEKVCAVDPFCCDKVWDVACAARAEDQCGDPIEQCGESPRSCWIASFWTQGCNDVSCCQTICRDIDPFCCEIRWDAVCAYQANFVCQPDFPTVIGRDGCLDVHDSPGCAVAACSRAVCSADPTCCTESWDIDCVVIASAVCPAAYSCPAPGDCTSAHGNPGCRDTACCNGVCLADPSCCSAAWDATCAAQARALCSPPSGSDWNCPCAGDCFSTHDNPGCDSESCCSIVCNVSPICCTESWDAECATLASLLCSGPVGCASGTNGPCLEPHASPYCNDPYCCDTVCSEDPLCCSTSWDFVCVEIAVRRCASQCGMRDAGNCFSDRDLPGCSQGDCCARICQKDPVCCTASWDAACVAAANSKDNEDVCLLPQCGDPDAGSPCEPYDGPASSSESCCEAVCKIDSYCCDVEWDISCVEFARTQTDCGCAFECGDPCGGSCCSAHENAGCSDGDCCKLVCAQDSFCCDSQWDVSCAELARQLCDGPNDACPAPQCGDARLPGCCVPSPVARCSDEACCDAVCKIDPFCCEGSWDLACVQRAGEVSACDCDQGGCGSPDAGSCFSPNGTPGCEDLGCCQTICAFDPSCCEVAWDDDCVVFAEFFCTNNFQALKDLFSEGKQQREVIRGGRGPALPPRVGPRSPMRGAAPAESAPLRNRVPVSRDPAPRRR